MLALTTILLSPLPIKLTLLLTLRIAFVTIAIFITTNNHYQLPKSIFSIFTKFVIILPILVAVPVSKPLPVPLPIINTNTITGIILQITETNYISKKLSKTYSSNSNSYFFQFSYNLTFSFLKLFASNLKS